MAFRAQARRDFPGRYAPGILANLKNDRVTRTMPAYEARLGAVYFTLGDPQSS
jgi:hypothetical protein